MQNMQSNPNIGKRTQLLPLSSNIPLAPKQPVLTYFYSIGLNWYKKDFPANKTRINITEDPHDSDIPIAIPNVQNLNIVFQKRGSEWYAFEASNTNFMTVNGVPKHQVIFRENDKHVICIDRIPFVFLFGGISKAKNKSEGKPGNDEFSLVDPTTATNFIYKKEKPCIIGSNEFCDNKLTNETATAFIFHHKDCCFLKTISSSPENPVTADGVSAETPVPLFDESKLIIGKYAADFHVLQDHSISKHDFKFSPENKLGRLSLLSVNESPDGENRITLPEAGKAIIIGRDPHSDAQIESSDISRKHAQLIIYEHSALLFDCYSTNGTFVNGEKIAKRMLHPGDIVSFGDTAFLFCYIE
jgi:hypothetical protein